MAMESLAEEIIGFATDFATGFEFLLSQFSIPFVFAFGDLCCTFRLLYNNSSVWKVNSDIIDG
jgi:hypothetical protein